MIENCLNCKIQFVLKKYVKYRQKKRGGNSGKFCSSKCFDSYRRVEIFVNCGNCDKEIKTIKSIINKSKSGKVFCSQSCSASYNNKFKLKERKKCLECNKNIAIANKKYCSNKCQGVFQFKEKIKNNNFSSKTAKKYLVLLNNCCSICNLGNIWNNKEIVLVLDHIDGNSENNNLSNLRLVCPNCDSQLPTFKSKNNGNGRAYRRQRYKEGKSY